MSHIHQLLKQAYMVFLALLTPCESKHLLRRQGKAYNHVHSFRTYHNYWPIIQRFVRSYASTFPDSKSIKYGRSYVPVWLQQQAKRGLAITTLKTYRSALNKLYGIHPGDRDYYILPDRHRADITRSRGPKPSDRHFSVTNNQDLVDFCRGSGLRREELSLLRGDDLWDRKRIESERSRLRTVCQPSKSEKAMLRALDDTRLFKEEFFVYVRCGKGGRMRYAPVIGPCVADIVARFQGIAPDAKVWPRIHTMADIHSFRRDYSNTLYRLYARPIEEIPYDRTVPRTNKPYRSQVYCCRRDLVGVWLDKRAMLVVSKALGHNRIGIFAQSYYIKD